MATFRRSGTIHKLGRLIEGMVGQRLRTRLRRTLLPSRSKGSASTASRKPCRELRHPGLRSSWVKHHYPEVFAAALLNSQPMGFYAPPAQFVRDAREHGVEVRPPDINASDWDCTLEPGTDNAAPCVSACARSPASARTKAGGWSNAAPNPIAIRSTCGAGRPARRQILALARADAFFASLGLSRRDGLWAVRGFSRMPCHCPDTSRHGRAISNPPSPCRRAHPGASRWSTITPPSDVAARPIRWHCCADAFPPIATVAPLPSLRRRRTTTASPSPAGAGAPAPGTASGVVFVTIEDEHGIANLVVWPGVFEDHRRIVMRLRLLGVRGRVRARLVIHLVAEKIVGLVGRARSDFRRSTPSISITAVATRSAPPGPSDHRSARPFQKPEANATRHRVGKGPAWTQPGYDHGSRSGSSSPRPP